MRNFPVIALAALAISLSPAAAQEESDFEENAVEATEVPQTAETAETADPAEGADAADAAEAAEAATEGPPRPADAPETASAEADLTECSAMLSAMSGASTSFIERDQLLRSSGAWLAAASAAGDGKGVNANERAEAWSQKVQSLRFLTPHRPWLDYCGSLAAAHGLDPAPFTERTN